MVLPHAEKKYMIVLTIMEKQYYDWELTIIINKYEHYDWSATYWPLFTNFHK